MEKGQEETNSNWLNAHSDPLARLYTFSSCITLADLNGDGDFKLVIADLGTGTYNMKIKVLKGTSVVVETTLLDLPTGVVTVFMDLNEPRTPGVVVASGCCLFVYKNMRPYYKYNLPTLTVQPEEQALWNQVRNGDIDVVTLAEALNTLKLEYESSALTSQTLHFLQLDTDEKALNFIEERKHMHLKRETIITCVATMKRSLAEEDAICCIVVGTEHKQLYIIDSQAFTPLRVFECPSIPVILNVSGMYDVDFRMFVACRDGKVYFFKKDHDEGKVILEIESQIVGMERVFKHIVIATMEQILACYTVKGRKLWNVELPANVLCTALMDHKSKGFKAIIVGLENKTVRIFRDKNLVDTLKLIDRPQALCFGRYGREDSTLVAVLASGALQLLIMKRTAEYSEQATHRGPPASQRKKINVPKKSQLYVDQSIHERENSVAMFQNFQHDLQLMKLNVAQTYLKSMQSSITPISDNPDLPLKLSATVQGIGPTFQMILSIENTGSPTSTDPKLIIGIKLLFRYPNKVYNISPEILNLPALVPGVLYKFFVRIECIETDQPTQDTVTALIVQDGNSKPVVTANISMPISEGVIVV